MPRGFGVKESVFDRTGLGVIGCAAAGASQKVGPVVYTKAGYASIAGVGAASSESRFTRRGHGGGQATISQLSFNNGYAIGSSAARQKLAQSFQSPTPFAVTALQLGLQKLGSPVDNVTFEIQTDSSGSPSGTVLGSYTVAASSFSTSSGLVTIAGTIPGLTLSAGATYWIVASRSGTFGTSNAITWYGDRGLYPDGSVKIWDGSSWGNFTQEPLTFDLAFQFSSVAPSVLGYGSSVFVAGGAGAVYTTAGYATIGGVGSGVSQKISGAGAVYTKAGFAIIGGVGAGPSSSDEFSSGLAVAGLVGAGASASVFVETGFATLGGVGSGPRARDLGRTGFATLGGVASGASASVFTRSGLGVAGTVGAGFTTRVGVQAKTGFATAGGVGSGPSASVAAETGFATAGGIGTGARARLLARSGYATVGGVGSGARERLELRSGYATADLTATGSSASVFAKAGAAIAGLVGAGSSIRAFGGIIKSGSATAGLTAHGARTVTHARVGAGLAGLIAVGARRVVYVETGYTVIEGTGTGTREIDRVRGGWGTAGVIGSGHVFLPGRQPLPPGQILPPILGHIPAGLMPRIEQARTGQPAGPGRGTIAAGQGGSTDG